MKEKFTLSILLLATFLGSGVAFADAQPVQLALFDDYPLANWYFQEYGEPPALKKKDSQPTVTKTSKKAQAQTTKADKVKNGAVHGPTAQAKKQNEKR